MPNQFNPYDFPTLIEVLELLDQPNDFLLRTFSEEGQIFETEEVEIQTKKGIRVLAPYVSEYLDGKPIPRSGFTSKTYKPALVKPSRPLTTHDLKRVTFGESATNRRSAVERAVLHAAEDVADLNTSIDNRKIEMIRSGLFTGTIVQKGEGVSQILDFEHTLKVTLSGTDTWDQDTANPVEDVAGWRQEIIDANGDTPNILVADFNTASKLMRHKTTLALADNRGVQVGSNGRTFQGKGVTVHGYLQDADVTVVSVSGSYIDDNNTEQPIIPAGTIVLLNDNTPLFRFHYGLIVLIDADTKEFVSYDDTKIVPRELVDVNRNMRWLEMHTRPLPVPTNVNSWLVAKVL
ncbi:hypothetical protein AK95_14480 [Paenibacillus sp. LC231]|uniref:major capsid protein n=1 Tax=Paenibacillus sp. LC231 TaxID=1120679 RepID=UPI0008DE7DD2|nr:major capsid protein [Paenibacillus sp. LC231]OIB04820.1 hypothetical protein AK95_14480 [Paenibacillus sp. LC231]